MISNYICADDRVENFESAYAGPGVYLLYDGRRADKNIVYIGRSTRDCMIRVREHRLWRKFDRVGLILPRNTSAMNVKSLEVHLLHHYFDLFHGLPPENRRIEYLPPYGRDYNWTRMARRRADVSFE